MNCGRTTSSNRNAASAGRPTEERSPTDIAGPAVTGRREGRSVRRGGLTSVQSNALARTSASCSARSAATAGYAAANRRAAHRMGRLTVRGSGPIIAPVWHMSRATPYAFMAPMMAPVAGGTEGIAKRGPWTEHTDHSPRVGDHLLHDAEVADIPLTQAQMARHRNVGRLANEGDNVEPARLGSREERAAGPTGDAEDGDLHAWVSLIPADA